EAGRSGADEAGRSGADEAGRSGADEAGRSGADEAGRSGADEAGLGAGATVMPVSGTGEPGGKDGVVWRRGMGTTSRPDVRG
ncbi:MAG: hypothetical protein LBT40_11965, partial [Deltaproteobacteria bacterium]|nr:hypothetical protein [Deltaproteobacteria bacterium]